MTKRVLLLSEFEAKNVTPGNSQHLIKDLLYQEEFSDHSIIDSNHKSILQPMALHIHL
jgi:hypothetical protein